MEKLFEISDLYSWDKIIYQNLPNKAQKKRLLIILYLLPLAILNCALFTDTNLWSYQTRYVYLSLCVFFFFDIILSKYSLSVYGNLMRLILQDEIKLLRVKSESEYRVKLKKIQSQNIFSEYKKYAPYATRDEINSMLDKAYNDAPSLSFIFSRVVNFLKWIIPILTSAIIIPNIHILKDKQILTIILLLAIYIIALSFTFYFPIKNLVEYKKSKIEKLKELLLISKIK